MKIASVTVTSNREDLIGDALRSVPWVDLACIVDVGVEDGTIQAAISVMGDRVRTSKFTDASTMGEMRNYGNAWARECGADWAMILDTDERIHGDEHSIRFFLQSASADVVMVESVDEHGSTYPKERFFRLPATVAFNGHCHERIEYAAKAPAIMPRVRFSEIKKTKEQMAAKAEALIAALEEDVTCDPDNGWAWYHLGESQAYLKHWGRAADAFAVASETMGGQVQRAWACMRKAQVLYMAGMYERALGACIYGMGIDPSIEELPWMAGCLCYVLDRKREAAFWARMSSAIGCMALGHSHRPWHSIPKGRWEGPFELLEQCYQDTGNLIEASRFRSVKERAAKGRENA